MKSFMRKRTPSLGLKYKTSDAEKLFVLNEDKENIILIFLLLFFIVSL